MSITRKAKKPAPVIKLPALIQDSFDCEAGTMSALPEKINASKWAKTSKEWRTLDSVVDKKEDETSSSPSDEKGEKKQTKYKIDTDTYANLVKAISLFLRELMKSEKRSIVIIPQEKPFDFHCKKLNIEIEKFCRLLCGSFKLSIETVITGLIYLDRAFKKGCPVDRLNINLLLLTSLYLAHVRLNDSHFKLSAFAKFANLETSILKSAEVRLLNLLEHNLEVKSAEVLHFFYSIKQALQSCAKTPDCEPSLKFLESFNPLPFISVDQIHEARAMLPRDFCLFSCKEKPEAKVDWPMFLYVSSRNRVPLAEVKFEGVELSITPKAGKAVELKLEIMTSIILNRLTETMTFNAEKKRHFRTYTKTPITVKEAEEQDEKDIQKIEDQEKKAAEKLSAEMASLRYRAIPSAAINELSGRHPLFDKLVQQEDLSYEDLKFLDKEFGSQPEVRLLLEKYRVTDYTQPKQQISFPELVKRKAEAEAKKQAEREAQEATSEADGVKGNISRPVLGGIQF